VSLTPQPWRSSQLHNSALAPSPLHEPPLPAESGRERPVPAAAPPLTPIVIRFGRLGDMIMLTSVLHLLRNRYRQPCVVLGAGTWNSQVYRGHPDVARICSFPRHAPFVLSPTWWRVLWMLHRTDPSPVYVCERHPRQLARVRRLLAWSGINPARCLFITDMPADGSEHWVDHFVRFGGRTPPMLRPSDYPPAQPDSLPAPRLTVLDSERRAMEAWIAAKGWSGRPLVLIQPGNYRSLSSGRKRWRRRKADDKAWPVGNWVQLLERIGARIPDARILLCGAPAEAPMLREIAAAARCPEVVVAILRLRALFALCERAHSMISVDTGPGHAAAALGVPLTVIFGAEPQRLWLPRGPANAPVLGVGGPPSSVRVDQIPVDDVFRTWCALRLKMEPATEPRTRALNDRPAAAELRS
jgi:ADP-heptose:LPS heptosyltransferase